MNSFATARRSARSSESSPLRASARKRSAVARSSSALFSAIPTRYEDRPYLFHHIHGMTTLPLGQHSDFCPVLIQVGPAIRSGLSLGLRFIDDTGFNNSAVMERLHDPTFNTALGDPLNQEGGHNEARSNISPNFC